MFRDRQAELADEVWRALTRLVFDHRDSWRRAVVDESGLPFSRIRILRRLERAPMTVKQTATDLTVEQTRGEMKVTQSYKLDGTESVNKMTMGRGENAREVESKSTAKWDGAKLVISTTRPGQDGTPMTTTQTWSLEGGNLVVERPGRDGAVQKTVYKKTT